MDVLLERARWMRNNPTELEKRLWRVLSRSQSGYKFRRQHVIFPFICDFFCPSKGLIVEGDGDTHSEAKDAKRDGYPVSKGFSVLRVTNDDVRENMDGVFQAIQLRAAALPERWPGPTPTQFGGSSVSRTEPKAPELLKGRGL